jgi:hypothetical protein
MPELTARQRRGIEYRRQVAEAAREFTFAETVLGLNDPQAVCDWGRSLVTARMTQDGRIFAPQCLRGHDRVTAFAWDVEPDTICAGCGKRLDQHQARHTRRSR